MVQQHTLMPYPCTMYIVSLMLISNWISFLIRYFVSVFEIASMLNHTINVVTKSIELQVIYNLIKSLFQNKKFQTSPMVFLILLSLQNKTFEKCHTKLCTMVLMLKWAKLLSFNSTILAPELLLRHIFRKKSNKL